MPQQEEVGNPYANVSTGEAEGAEEAKIEEAPAAEKMAKAEEED